VTNATVIMQLSWKDVTETSVEELFGDCKPKNLRN
jgi:hypothetical protein